MRIPENEDNLLTLLVEKTEDKSVIENQPKPNLEDFETIEPEITETETEEEATDKPLTKAACKNTAEMLVDIVDGAACLVIPTVYKKKLFGSKQKYNEAKNLFKKQRSGVILTDIEIDIVDKLNEYRDFQDDLAITEDEKAMIVKPLAAVLFKHQKTASPETMLIMAVGAVYLPKVLPIIF